MGSRAADLVRTAERSAVATLTPWQLGRGLLPKLGPDGGLAWLLERRVEVGLTSPARALTQRLPQRVGHSLLVNAVQRRALPGGGPAIDVKAAYDPDECWIAVTFGRDGALEATVLGREALLIVDG